MRLNMLLKILITYDDVEFIKLDGFDDAVIGCNSDRNRLIYSAKKCIKILMKNGLSYEEASEYFDYNIDSLKIKNGPIICDDDF